VDSFYIYQGDILLNEELLSLLTIPDLPEGRDETVSTRANVYNKSSPFFFLQKIIFYQIIFQIH